MRLKGLQVVLALIGSNLLGISAANATEPTWIKIYELQDPTRYGDGFHYLTGYGLNIGDAAAVYKSSGQSFDKIRYRMELTIAGNLYFADVTFDKWNNAPGSSFTSTPLPTIDNLQIPTGQGGSGSFAIQTNINNLTVQSNFPGISDIASPIQNGTGFNGRLEIWPSCYGPTSSGLLPAGSDDRYDFNDSGFSGDSDCYGSFQVHNLTTMQTVLAHNRGGSEVGLGNYLGPSLNPDWTFALGDNNSLLNLNAANGAQNLWKLQIFVGNSTSPKCSFKGNSENAKNSVGTLNSKSPATNKSNGAGSCQNASTR